MAPSNFDPLAPKTILTDRHGGSTDVAAIIPSSQVSLMLIFC
jgi:hypothetical protein